MRRIALLTIAFLLAGCGSDRDEPAGDDGGATATSDLTGRIQADGSSTVGPYTTAAAERFRRENPDVRITVGVSGTGGGFERFCAGETDLSNASRAIEDDEKQACAAKGIEYVEFHIANDALTIVVNPENDWADCLTVAELKRVWNTGSKVDNWSQVRSGFPDVSLRLFGAGTDSGTFDYFTAAINGEEGASRSDYSATEDDNVTVEGVAGNKGGMGYFGLSYYEQNKERLKALAIDGGGGCVEPNVETAQSGDYKPLSRPLYIYAKKTSFERPEVAAFIKFILDNETEIAQAAQFVPLTDEQLEKAKATFEASTS
jgi:phosphate transport system substrate-binding protein